MFVGEADLPGGSAEPQSADTGDAAGLPIERLEQEIVQLASHINAGTCRWLELVAEFDRREGWGSWSCRSCAEWLAWQCALDSRSAREHVRVARSLEGVPRIHAAFARGQLSYSKVRALTRVADADSEGGLLELAEHATAAQLDRIVRGLRRMSTDDANDAHAGRHLSCWWEGDGTLSISGNLPAEEGAAFMAALDAMHDLIRNTTDRDTTCVRNANGSAEPGSEPDTCGSAEPPLDQEPARPEDRPATNADALVAMAEWAVGGGEERPGGERYEVVVHVGASTLAQVEDGSALAPETIRRLACDSSVVPLYEDGDGNTLNVGRRRRSVPAPLGRALRARDGTCRFPGCENRRFLESHHIVHWAHGGETNADNLVRFCGRHHRLLHEGGYSVERLRSGALRFKDRVGRVLRDSPRSPAGHARALPATDSFLQPGSGERLDLDLAVSGLATTSSFASSCGTCP